LEQSSPHIGILFFSRSAKAESKVKRFAADGNIQTDEAMAHHFISHSLKQARATGLPITFCDEETQHGSTFGTRFSNAFSTMFARGFDYVIAIGNDTPALSAKHIQKAADQLRSGQADIVLGPATDGGTWLTALSKEAFSTGGFQQLPWQKNTLFDSILQQFRDHFSISCLDRFSDLDDPQSVTAFLRQKTHRLLGLINILRSFLAGLYSYRKHQEHALPTFSFYTCILLRAPPLT